jgi:hypothetical protein
LAQRRSSALRYDQRYQIDWPARALAPLNPIGAQAGAAGLDGDAHSLSIPQQKLPLPDESDQQARNIEFSGFA